MKTIQAYEYHDLTKDVQDKVIERLIDEQVRFELQNLAERDDLSEEDYWNEVGCSKSYGDSTPAFVPSVYYEKHKEYVDETCKIHARSCIYMKDGQPIHNFIEI